MKKSILFFISICLIGATPVFSQGGLLKKVAKSMGDELLGRPQNKNADMPEPACACDKPELMMDLGGKLQLDYTELTISISDDGRILAQQHGEYYIVQNGVTTGPIKAGDKRLAAFENVEDPNNGENNNSWLNNPYISKSGDKYLINFGGKSYGPYSQISEFTVSRLKDKFAAMVIENIVVTEDQGMAMDEAMKNARTEQEKIDLAMKYAQQITQKYIEGGGVATTTPKIVTNIADVNFDFLQSRGGKLNGKVKYNDILITSYDKVSDLNGKTVLDLSLDVTGNELFINSDNTKYAAYNYGTLTFSDKKVMSDLFSPYLVKVNDQVFLAYMYYSPKKNSIMQCKVPF